MKTDVDARASTSEEAKEHEDSTTTTVNPREQEEIALSLVKAGDVLRVLPGASVPTDGVVLEGQSYVGEAMLTGEAMPVHKGPGDAVLGTYAGCRVHAEQIQDRRKWMRRRLFVCLSVCLSV